MSDHKISASRNATSPPRIEVVAVPGARLHVETRGAGPVVLCIVGGNGDAEVFTRMAAGLTGQFTVVTYDRRGFARSPLDEAPDDATRLAIDADDVAQLVAHLGVGPVDMFGSSSGAMVGLEVLVRHPGCVRRLVAHEPPVLTLLPDAATWLATLDRVHATYLASGAAPAMAEFSAAVGMPPPPSPPPGAQLPPSVAALLARMPANHAFWLAHELRVYPRWVPDLDALAASASKLVLATGRDSRGSVLGRTAPALAAALHLPIAEMIGGHIGYATNPAEFAAELAGLLPDAIAA
jgi:pimeloyl-ACP methyl ester carboxylesterase